MFFLYSQVCAIEKSFFFTEHWKNTFTYIIHWRENIVYIVYSAPVLPLYCLPIVLLLLPYYFFHLCIGNYKVEVGHQVYILSSNCRYIVFLLLLYCYHINFFISVLAIIKLKMNIRFTYCHMIAVILSLLCYCCHINFFNSFLKIIKLKLDIRFT